jgi:hypothetical protein
LTHVHHEVVRVRARVVARARAEMRTVSRAVTVVVAWQLLECCHFCRRRCCRRPAATAPALLIPPPCCPLPQYCCQRTATAFPTLPTCCHSHRCAAHCRHTADTLPPPLHCRCRQCCAACPKMTKECVDFPWLTIKVIRFVRINCCFN